jgi:hypothetical protein
MTKSEAVPSLLQAMNAELVKSTREVGRCRLTS